MYFSWSSITALGLLARVASAVPAPTATGPASPGATDTAVIWMCKGTDADGPCQAQAFELGTCSTFPQDYSGKLGGVQNMSYLSDTSTVKCLWYLSDDCSGDSYDNQDDENLTDGNGDFAHTRSAMCKPDTDDW